MGVSRSGYILLFFLIQLVGFLGWLCHIAVAQVDLGESVIGSVSAPDMVIAFMGNLAVFVTSLLRGRLDLEIGARDVLAIRRIPGLDDLTDVANGFGLTTCKESPEPENRFAKASVLMLSFDAPVSSMRQFMKYFSEAYKVHSILLQCFPLKSQSAELLPGICNCKLQDGGYECKCIVFWNLQDIVKVLDKRMPGSLKPLSDSLCLLPSPECLKNGCHGCTDDQFNLEEIDEPGRKKEKQAGKQAVDEIFEYVSKVAMKMEHPCICIPLSPLGYDNWMQLLRRSLGGKNRFFSKGAPFTVPRLTEVLLNIVLTGWFRVDGLSSALLARRAIRDYVVQGGGFAANAFLAGAYKLGNYECWVLNFRGSRSGIRSFSFMIGFFNLFCSIFWVLFVSLQPTNIGKWYDKHSESPSKYSVIVAILVGIGIALGMDCLHLYLSSASKEPTSTASQEATTSTASQEATTGKGLFAPIINVWRRVKVWFQRMLQFCLPLLVCLHLILQFWGRLKVRDLILQFWGRLKVRGLKKTLLRPKEVLVCAVIALELICILFGSLLLGILGPKCFGRWVYGALQVLVWVKWATGSYLLGEYPPEYDSQSKDENGILVYSYALNYDNGILVYSSAFLLNAVLAGVRFQWHYATDLDSLN